VAHHKFLRRLLDITWKQSQECRNLETDRVKEVGRYDHRERLRWQGYRMCCGCRRQAICWNFTDTAEDQIDKAKTALTRCVALGFLMHVELTFNV